VTSSGSAARFRCRKMRSATGPAWITAKTFLRPPQLQSSRSVPNARCHAWARLPDREATQCRVEGEAQPRTLSFSGSSSRVWGRGARKPLCLLFRSAHRPAPARRRFRPSDRDRTAQPRVWGKNPSHSRPTRWG
jgi:hypothetical protein